ncbi:unnamed protein product [Ectocarpus sp. 6 AP-2014]
MCPPVLVTPREYTHRVVFLPSVVVSTYFSVSAGWQRPREGAHQCSRLDTAAGCLLVAVVEYSGVAGRAIERAHHSPRNQQEGNSSCRSSSSCRKGYDQKRWTKESGP